MTDKKKKTFSLDGIPIVSTSKVPNFPRDIPVEWQENISHSSEIAPQFEPDEPPAWLKNMDWKSVVPGSMVDSNFAGWALWHSQKLGYYEATSNITEMQWICDRPLYAENGYICPHCGNPFDSLLLSNPPKTSCCRKEGVHFQDGPTGAVYLDLHNPKHVIMMLPVPLSEINETFDELQALAKKRQDLYDGDEE